MSNIEFDLTEFRESYAHYRHLEQERARHLAFFFTLVGGLLGLLGVLNKDGKVTDWFLFVAVLTVLFLQLLELVTFAAIRRIGDAREQHAKTMRHLRKKLSPDKIIADQWAAFENRKHLSVQNAAEATLHAFALLFVTAAGSAAIYALNTSQLAVWRGVVVLCLTVGLFVAHVVVWLCLKPR